MGDGQAYLRVLGGVELCDPDGRPVRSVLAQPKRLALLIYLAAAGLDAFQRRDTLLAMFWPDADRIRARRALNRAVYFLRQAIGRDAVVTRGEEEVGIATTQLVCDVVLFEQALAAGVAERALELYRGDLAPGLHLSDVAGFERWLDDERARLRGRAVESAVRLAEQEAEAGRLGPAERWAHRASVLSPYDERVAALRIGLLDRLGDRGSAVRAFGELERRLHDDLEVEPSPEIRAQSEAMRSRRESRVAQRPPQPVAPVRAEEVLLRRRGSVGFRHPAVVAALATTVMLGTLVYRLVPGRSMVLTTDRALPITSEPGIEFQPALSPDGRQVAYTTLTPWHTGIVVRSTMGADGRGEIRLAAGNGEGQAFPSWSPDGEFVRFANTAPPPGNFSTTVWNEVSRLGSVARRMPLPRNTKWIAWSRDGNRVAFTVDDSIFVYRSTDHAPRLLAVHDGGWEPHSLAWSPDGRWIAYVNGNPLWPRAWNVAFSSVWLVATESGARTAVTAGDHLNVSPAWLDDRHLLFVSDQDGRREVYVVEIGATGPTGAVVKVPGGTDAHSISVSADGRRLAVAKFIARQNVWSFPMTEARPLSAREGRPVTSGTQVVETHALSPDGQSVAYNSDFHADASLYLLRINGGIPVPLVTNPRPVFFPAWSPDGREIAFSGGPDNGLWVVPAEGGAATRLTETGEEIPIWSRDGLTLAFQSHLTGRTEAGIITRDRIGGRWSPPRRVTNFGCAFQLWAKDGSGLICGRPSSTVLTLVSPLGAVIWRRDLAADGLSELGPPVASENGAVLYLRAVRDGERGIWAWPIAGGRARLVLPFADSSLVVQSYSGTITAANSRLYLTVGEFESDIWVMNLEWR